MKIKDFDERKITEFSLVFGNTGFLGIPLFDALLPENGGFVASFFIVGFNILLWIIGLGIIARGREDIKLTPKKIFINKGTIASLIGFIIFFIPAIPACEGFALPSFISTAISYISGLCTPISMLLAGALIARKSLKSIVSSAKIYYLLALRLITVPIIFCFFFKVIGFSDFWVIFLTVALGLPSATSTITFAEVFNTSPEYAAQCVGATTLFSIATMPCVVLLAKWVCTLNISITQFF
ncbi:MAG: AEC family transporter, partial [Clostridia bacterium]|nr:AEC family transporter [Clostridia bacterium]